MGFTKKLSRAVVLNIILSVLVICTGHFIFYFFG
jgi:hypothetical protein